jgi:cytochrome c-type biogenesis protein
LTGKAQIWSEYGKNWIGLVIRWLKSKKIKMTTPTNTKTDAGGAFGHYTGLILLLFVIGLGYAGFRYFAITQMPQPGTFNLLALAVIAGVASFFSPCAFPLLPSYLSFYAAARGDDDPSSRPARTLGLGLAAAVGVVSFTLILGAIICLLGAGAGQALSISGPEPSQFVRWFRGGVGLILVALGVAQWLNANLKPGLADSLAWRTRPNRHSQKPAATLYLYGLGYNAAGMGCTGPILAGLTVFAFTTGGFSAAITAFAVFALTMGGLMLLVSGLVASSQETLIQRLKAGTPYIKQVTSLLLVLVGLFNIFTALSVDLFVRLLFP